MGDACFAENQNRVKWLTILDWLQLEGLGDEVWCKLKLEWQISGQIYHQNGRTKLTFRQLGSYTTACAKRWLGCWEYWGTLRKFYL